MRSNRVRDKRAIFLVALFAISPISCYNEAEHFMNFISIIENKKNALALTKNEIDFFIEGYTKGTIPDYQISALLMAICLNGMDNQETVYLTQAMLNSGDKVDLTQISGIKVDKHSSGGVADTTTFITLPIAASCGVKIAKMSGRGLGHTGGTLDKLSAIPNYNAALTSDQFISIVQRCNCSLIGQTNNLAPADKKLYALRDATATVGSLPLIASSIMSKKLASGCDAILLDVKTGSGALLCDLNQSTMLAKTMCNIGNSLGVKTKALITDMNQPLGHAIGNILELIEAADILKGNITSTRLSKLATEEAAQMILLGEQSSSIKEAREMAQHALSSQAAFFKLKEMIELHGGDFSPFLDYSLFPKATVSHTLRAQADGIITSMETAKIGRAAMLLGAGRAQKDLPIDLTAGIIMHCNLGDIIKSGTPLATFYTNKESLLEEAIALFESSLKMEEWQLTQKESVPLIYDEITH